MSLASAKIRKLSLSPSFGFQKPTVEEEGSHFQQHVVPFQRVAFEVSDRKWEALFQDPIFRKDLERAIDDRVKQELEKRTEQYREDQREKASKEGYETGFSQGKEQALQQGREELSRIMKDLETISEQFQVQREELLLSHEKEWAQALLHILKRFLILRSQSSTEVISNWLKDSIGQPFPHDLAIRVSPDWSERNAAWLSQETSMKWIADPSLKPGEFRWEWEHGGIFFSETDSFKRLDQMLEANFPELKTNAA